ncbi:Holliday junction branch migration protein RuvA [Corynebacterium uropygiale]|uniref:Holliday junction branch migration complex subunit RuvA n=1 Tax=Corynebacterium uropygiale TaxID=1775911 RepID=A0A9X1U0I8_9CORY|nr:Holliday junction branch migration protein RuvA [Corynebacterium uropygiale]MCF4006528.1 Holliday junction branch migration protein RuvA [Corynebacterium uropygiale]
MIASLRGTVIDISLTGAVVECAGVGYGFLASPRTLSTLVRGEEAMVLTSMVVRDSDIQLFGFSSAESREMFHLLRGVSGLGPKIALAVDSVFSPAEVARAIREKDARSLQRVPGVGKRMADRMIVDLQDKVAAFAEPADVGESVAGEAAGVAAAAPSGAVAQQVTEALVSLGFPEKTATSAVEAVLAEHPEADTSDALRESLSRIGGAR